MWVDMVICCITFNFPPPLQVKNQQALDGAEQAALPGVVHIDAGPAWERRRLWEIFRKTHISRRLGVILFLVPFQTSNDLHVVLGR